MTLFRDLAFNYHYTDKDHCLHFLTHLPTNLPRDYDLAEIFSPSADTVITSEYNCTILRDYFMYEGDNLYPVEAFKTYALVIDNEAYLISPLKSYYNSGSMMFFIEGTFGTILYTGYLSQTTVLTEHGILRAIKERKIFLDYLFIDSTYLELEAPFSNSDHIIDMLIDLFRLNKKCRYFFHVPSYGMEDILAKVASGIKEYLIVDEAYMDILESLGYSRFFTTNDRFGRIKIVSKMIFHKKNRERERRHLVLLRNTDAFVQVFRPYARKKTAHDIFTHQFNLYGHCNHFELEEWLKALTPAQTIPLYFVESDKTYLLIEDDEVPFPGWDEEVLVPTPYVDEDYLVNLYAKKQPLVDQSLSHITTRVKICNDSEEADSSSGSNSFNQTCPKKELYTTFVSGAGDHGVSSLTSLQLSSLDKKDNIKQEPSEVDDGQSLPIPSQIDSSIFPSSSGTSSSTSTGFLSIKVEPQIESQEPFSCEDIEEEINIFDDSIEISDEEHVIPVVEKVRSTYNDCKSNGDGMNSRNDHVINEEKVHTVSDDDIILQQVKTEPMDSIYVDDHSKPQLLEICKQLYPQLQNETRDSNNAITLSEEELLNQDVEAFVSDTNPLLSVIKREPASPIEAGPSSSFDKEILTCVTDSPSSANCSVPQTTCSMNGAHDATNSSVGCRPSDLSSHFNSHFILDNPVDDEEFEDIIVPIAPNLTQVPISASGIPSELLHGKVSSSIYQSQFNETPSYSTAAGPSTSTSHLPYPSTSSSVSVDLSSYPQLHFDRSSSTYTTPVDTSPAAHLPYPSTSSSINVNMSSCPQLHFGSTPSTHSAAVLHTSPAPHFNFSSSPSSRINYMSSYSQLHLGSTPSIFASPVDTSPVAHTDYPLCSSSPFTESISSSTFHHLGSGSFSGSAKPSSSAFPLAASSAHFSNRYSNNSHTSAPNKKVHSPKKLLTSAVSKCTTGKSVTSTSKQYSHGSRTTTKNSITQVMDVAPPLIILDDDDDDIILPSSKSDSNSSSTKQIISSVTSAPSNRPSSSNESMPSSSQPSSSITDTRRKRFPPELYSTRPKLSAFLENYFQDIEVNFDSVEDCEILASSNPRPTLTHDFCSQNYPPKKNYSRVAGPPPNKKCISSTNNQAAQRWINVSSRELTSKSVPLLFSGNVRPQKRPPPLKLIMPQPKKSSSSCLVSNRVPNNSTTKSKRNTSTKNVIMNPNISYLVVPLHDQVNPDVTDRVGSLDDNALDSDDSDIDIRSTALISSSPKMSYISRYDLMDCPSTSNSNYSTVLYNGSHIVKSTTLSQYVNSLTETIPNNNSSFTNPSGRKESGISGEAHNMSVPRVPKPATWEEFKSSNCVKYKRSKNHSIPLKSPGILKNTKSLVDNSVRPHESESFNQSVTIPTSSPDDSISFEITELDFVDSPSEVNFGFDDQSTSKHGELNKEFVSSSPKGGQDNSVTSNVLNSQVGLKSGIYTHNKSEVHKTLNEKLTSTKNNTMILNSLPGHLDSSDSLDTSGNSVKVVSGIHALQKTRKRTKVKSNIIISSDITSNGYKKNAPKADQSIPLDIEIIEDPCSDDDVPLSLRCKEPLKNRYRSNNSSSRNIKRAKRRSLRKNPQEREGSHKGSDQPLKPKIATADLIEKNSATFLGFSLSEQVKDPSLNKDYSKIEGEVNNSGPTLFNSTMTADSYQKNKNSCSDISLLRKIEESFICNYDVNKENNPLSPRPATCDSEITEDGDQENMDYVSTLQKTKDLCISKDDATNPSQTKSYSSQIEDSTMMFETSITPLQVSDQVTKSKETPLVRGSRGKKSQKRLSSTVYKLSLRSSDKKKRSCSKSVIEMGII